jgi:hypothetical protein
MFNDSNKPRGVEVFILTLRNIDDLGPAIARAAAQRVDAVLVTHGLPSRFRARLAGALARLRLPTMYPDRIYLELGGLMSLNLDWMVE